MGFSGIKTKRKLLHLLELAIQSIVTSNIADVSLCGKILESYEKSVLGKLGNYLTPMTLEKEDNKTNLKNYYSISVT